MTRAGANSKTKAAVRKMMVLSLEFTISRPSLCTVRYIWRPRQGGEASARQSVRLERHGLRQRLSMLFELCWPVRTHRRAFFWGTTRFSGGRRDTRRSSRRVCMCGAAGAVREGVSEAAAEFMCNRHPISLVQSQQTPTPSVSAQHTTLKQRARAPSPPSPSFYTGVELWRRKLPVQKHAPWGSVLDSAFGIRGVDGTQAVLAQAASLVMMTI
jgi:hypothetical protein